MSALAVEPSRRRVVGALPRVAARALLLPVGLAVLWGFWEGYRWLGIRQHWTWPFTVNDTNMPHVSTIWHAFGQPLQPDGPPLRHYLWHYALFTGKEALAGFALGAVIGFLLAVLLAHSTVVRRGFLPYIVVSQTVPILAIAPMVVVGLGTKGVNPSVGVAVIAAYLTFFPVAINTLRGLLSPDPRALELMRSYAAGRWRILWRLRVPTSLPYVFSALKISATASVIGAIIGETPASLQGGLGYAIVNFNQYYSTQPANLWATIVVCALLGITFYLAIVVLERLVLKRAPEHFA
jgi:NitT/TauT family transport system permease protein